MRFRHWIGFLVISALILTFSTDSFVDDAEYVDQLTTPLEASAYVLTFYSNARHILAFVLLGLSAFPFRKRYLGNFCIGLVVCGLVALASELLQGFTVYRTPRVSDVALNLGAAFIGLGVTFFPSSILHRLRDTGSSPSLSSATTVPAGQCPPTISDDILAGRRVQPVSPGGLLAEEGHRAGIWLNSNGRTQIGELSRNEERNAVQEIRSPGGRQAETGLQT